jgi:predicted esterase
LSTVEAYGNSQFAMPVPSLNVRHASQYMLLLVALGSFSPGISSQENAELRLTATAEEILGKEAAEHFSGVLSADADISWQVYVPPNYDPDVPAGLMVYVPPVKTGRMRPGWRPVMAEKNLIWIAANQSGNKIDAGLRITYAVLATILAGQHYSVDRERIYISGFSGGGRVASVVAPQYPHIFKGAVYNCGVNFWGGSTPPRMDLVRENRFVFITGSKDFNRRETRRAEDAYRKVGVENVLLLDIPGMSHSNPAAADFAKAIEFLDLEKPSQADEPGVMAKDRPGA